MEAQGSLGEGPPLVERDALLERWGVAHVFTGRPGGVSRGPFASLNLGLHVGDEPDAVRENRRRALDAAGVDPAWLTLGEQVHGDRVVRVGRPERGAGAWEASTALPAADGLVTREEGVVLGVLVADCVPILLSDPEAGVVASAHAGWRGTLAGIAGQAVQAMVDAGARPDRILAAMGPSIGPCCYRVSDDLAQRFAGALGDGVVQPASDGPHLDLRRANRIQLLASGLLEGHLSWQPRCTACENHRFFSHRAQRGRAGRQAALIWLPR